MALNFFFSHTLADKVGANLKILMKKSKGQEIWLDRYEMDLSDNIHASFPDQDVGVCTQRILNTICGSNGTKASMNFVN